MEEEREGGDAGGENERMRQRMRGNEVAEETREDVCELLSEIGRGRRGMREKVREKERGKVEAAPVTFDWLEVRGKQRRNDALSVLGKLRYVEGTQNQLDGRFGDFRRKKRD